MRGAYRPRGRRIAELPRSVVDVDRVANGLESNPMLGDRGNSHFRPSDKETVYKWANVCICVKLDRLE